MKQSLDSQHGFRQLPFDFQLQHEFVFGNFVCAAGNEELLENLQRTPAGTSLIYLWGPEGSGRSHLLQASCQLAESAVYLPLKLYSDQGAAILGGLEELDLVCLDDIDDVIPDREWELQLFTLFNNLRDRGGRLIVSALTAPAHLQSSLPDLASRLQWGLSYRLHLLDDDQKVAALRTRAEQLGIPLSEEVLAFIMLRSARSMKTLFRVLKQLDRLSLTEKRKITIPFVKQIMNW